MKEKRWDASNVAGNTRTKMISQVICSHNRDGSLWRDAATSTFALKWEETLLNLSSPFLNRYLYCTLNVTEFKKKKRIKKLSLNQQFVYVFKKLYVFYLLAFFFVFVFFKCVFGLDQTKGRRSLYCLDTEYVKVTFCFVMLPILKQFTGKILHA